MDTVKIQTKKELFSESNEIKKARPLFGKFIYEGELCVLFGDSNTGKSILANDIAFFTSGGGHEWKDIKSLNLPTLYVDMEMETRQWLGRYATAEPYITDLYRRAEVRRIANEKIISNVKSQIILSQGGANPPKFIIIDNITSGFGSIMSGAKMQELIFEFKSLKERFGLTILLIAHCPKRKEGKPITQNDLGGSKQILNFVDSAFAIAPSIQGEDIKYLKQIKTREDEKMSDVMTLRIVSEPYLSMQFIDYCDETRHIDIDDDFYGIYTQLPPEKEIQLVQMLTEGEYYSCIAHKLQLTKQFVIRYAIRNEL